MPITLTDLYPQISAWLNDNQGVVGLAIFVATIVFGWASGIFSALRRRPKFKMSLIDGPTFCCTYPTGKMYGQYEAHRTGIALYLSVSNIGSAPSSIRGISIGYHWNLRPLSIQWLKNTIGWFWLSNQSVSLEDFQVAIGKSVKVYPFLMQQNNLSPVQTDTFLNTGRSTNGVVYFEQSESWGGCFPAIKKGHVRLKIRVLDVFGGKHTSTFDVQAVALDDARKYCPAFGKTLSELHGGQAPDDTSNNSFESIPLQGAVELKRYGPLTTTTMKSTMAIGTRTPEDALRANVIDMAINFTATMRVFEKGSKKTITKLLADHLGTLVHTTSKEDFEKVHTAFCHEFVKKVRVAARLRKDGSASPTAAASYGHAAKIFDVCAKVFFYYCKLPGIQTAAHITQHLHAAIDTPILKRLKKLPNHIVTANTIAGIDEACYHSLQVLAAYDKITNYPAATTMVQYDDLVWSELSRQNTEHAH